MSVLHNVCAFGYANDIALILPTIYGLKNMLKVCESLATDYQSHLIRLTQN